MNQQEEFNLILELLNTDIFLSYKEVAKKHGGYASLHEAYGVIKEEFDELWDEIKLKQALRSSEKIANESIDVIVGCLKILYYLYKQKQNLDL